MWKNLVRRTNHRWQYNTPHARYMLFTQDYKHTRRTGNAFSCSSTTIVKRTRLIVTPYAQSIACAVLTMQLDTASCCCSWYEQPLPIHAVPYTSAPSHRDGATSLRPPLGHVHQRHPGSVDGRIGFGKRRFELLMLTTIHSVEYGATYSEWTLFALVRCQLNGDWAPKTLELSDSCFGKMIIVLNGVLPSGCIVFMMCAALTAQEIIVFMMCAALTAQETHSLFSIIYLMVCWFFGLNADLTLTNVLTHSVHLLCSLTQFTYSVHLLSSPTQFTYSHQGYDKTGNDLRSKMLHVCCNLWYGHLEMCSVCQLYGVHLCALMSLYQTNINKCKYSIYYQNITSFTI
jgi:hypothetical protein